MHVRCIARYLDTRHEARPTTAARARQGGHRHVGGVYGTSEEVASHDGSVTDIAQMSEVVTSLSADVRGPWGTIQTPRRPSAPRGGQARQA